MENNPITLKQILATTWHSERVNMRIYDPEYRGSRIVVTNDVPEALHSREVEGLYLESTKDGDTYLLVALKELPKEVYDTGYRICSICHQAFDEGYCFAGGLDYYCSTECLHAHYTDEEWEQECAYDGESYWTTWHD